MADLNNTFINASLKQLINQWTEMQKQTNKRLVSQGLNTAPVAQAAQEQLNKQFMEQLGQTIPGLNLQASREQQAAEQWAKQFGLQERGQRFSEQDSLRKYMEQIRQFNEQSSIQKRQNDINELIAQGQMESNRYQQGQGQWMNLLGGLAGIGLTPATGGTGWLLNLINKLGGGGGGQTLSPSLSIPSYNSLFRRY